MALRHSSRVVVAAVLALGVASPASAQTTVYDFAANDGGFTPDVVSGSASAAWVYTPPGGGGGFWSTNGATIDTISTLTSPDINISSTTTVTGTFTHNYNFEMDSFGFYDGGILEFRADTGGGFGAWQMVAPSLVTGHGYDGTLGFQNPLGSSVQGFAGSSFGVVTTNFALGTGSTAQEFSAGNVAQFRFTGGWDPSTAPSGANWLIGSAAVTLAPVPEPASVLAVGALAAGGFTWFRRRRMATAV